LFEEQVKRTPDAVAVVFENQQLTYQQLNIRANQLAHYLRTLGVAADVLVGLCVKRSLLMIVGLLGILKAGGAYVPLDPDYPQERLSFMLEDANVSVLLTQHSLIERLPKHQAQVVCLDEVWEEIAQNNQDNPKTEVRAFHLANVIYTSGSTGKPKGVMVEHRGLCNLAQAQIQTFGLDCDSRVLQFASVSFDASISEVVIALGSGATLYKGTKDSLMPGMPLIERLRDYCITHITLPPSALAVMPTEQLPSLQTIIVAGEACSIELIKLWSAGRNFFNAYGPTEASVCATVAKCTPNDEKVSIGRPISNARVYILDQNLQPVPVGVPGELHIGGVGLARGYRNRPDLTQEKFIPNPFDNSKSPKIGPEETSDPTSLKIQKSKFYKTGDIARYLPDGNIEYLGRMDNQVKVRGYRIELGEIEAVLSQHEDVQTCCVIVREDIPGDQRLVAYVVPQTEQTPKVSQLRSFLKEKLPEYMIPSAIVILESLQLTPNGKLDRSALPVPSKSSNYDTFVAPRNQLELQLVQIWSKILKVDMVGVQDNFFDLGGHSLLAIYLMTQIQQQFGKDIPLVTLFQHPTVEHLASMIQKDSDFASESALVAIQSNGSNLPLFCIPGAGAYPFYLYHLARCLGPDQPFYSFQAHGLDGHKELITQVEDLAAHYIQAIQTIQPHGPYLLAGHSFGGKVAFEMTQQLLERGHVVALVAIVDSLAPMYQQHVGVDWDHAQWLSEFAKFMELAFASKLDISAQILQSLLPDEQVKYVLEQLKMVNILPLDAESMQLHNLVQVYKANCLVNYVPQQVYPTRITLLRASEALVEESSEFNSKTLEDSTWGWSKFSSEPVDLCFVPGNHITMMTQPHVQVLAERLKACIHKALLTDGGVLLASN
jgi:amino acid adenylation domain-containing protein